MMLLRPYQIDSVAQIIAATDPMVVAPTGSGKTVIVAEVIRQAEHKFVLVIAHRRELIHQMRDKLAEFGIAAGVILAGEPLNQMARVQVASVQTLWSRCMRGKTALPLADIVVIDEAHHCRARTYRKIVESYPDAKIIGLTATPCRRDGRGLGSTFKTMIETPQVEQLIDLGFLVKTRVYAPTIPDLKGIHTRQGDYVESELAERIDRSELVGDIITHWHRHAERRKTVVFATSVAHSIHLKDEFVKSGVRAEHIDGQTPKPERDEILAKLSRGELEVVVNCMVLTEGWDQPDVSCCVLARPTKSIGLYRQMAGRVIRPAPGKTDALILDHAGAVFQHGFVEDPVIWSLDPDTKAETPAHEARDLSPSTRALLACTKCSAVRTAGKPCPECGFMPRRPGEYLTIREGELAHLDRDGRQHNHHFDADERKRWHRMLAYIAQQRGYKAGWASYKFKEKFGTWPDSRHVEPYPPTPEVTSWVRSRQIAYAKAMQKATANA